MKNGLYRIQHDGIVQVAYFTSHHIDPMDDLLTLAGIWKLTEGYEIYHDDDVKILEGPLNVPNA
ncbi:hypothetical protein [Leptospira interrogans]|uniref:hypothetical protein n=1 Tax=Leptospira interrogans TaxID=173 RepID=UPI0040357286